MISKHYLKKETISEMIHDTQKKKPIRYVVWENFIDPDLYNKIENEIQQQSYKKVDTHSSNHRINKTVLLEWETLWKLFDFFEGPAFEKYLSLFLGREISQEFYVDRNDLDTFMWWKNFTWSVAQIYEKGDFFDWHIDWPIEKGSLWAFTYYLGWYNGEWNESFGWNLELWQKNRFWEVEAYTSIPYKKNTLVLIIASDEAYHRVTRLLNDALRISIQSTIVKK